MEIIIKKGYLKDLKKVPKTIFLASDATIDKLKASSSLEKSGVDYTTMDGQKKGENYYRIRTYDWRMGIDYVKPNIIIICILKRGDVYKYLPPK
jgi:mRNA-degrading endonuclease RelE of RelBE toxin-antitoxin system